MNLPERKHIRLKEYDYSTPGTYFVTVCAYEHRNLFARIASGENGAELSLTAFGCIARDRLCALEQRCPGLRIEKYVVMPNHIHALIAIEKAEKPVDLTAAVCAFKSLTTRECHRLDAKLRVFQTSFYDHVVRGTADYEQIWQYIDNNPAKWAEDRFFRE